MKPFQLSPNLYDLHVEPIAQLIGEMGNNQQHARCRSAKQQMQNGELDCFHFNYTCYIHPLKTSWILSKDLSDLNKYDYFCAETEAL